MLKCWIIHSKCPQNYAAFDCFSSITTAENCHTEGSKIYSLNSTSLFQVKTYNVIIFFSKLYAEFNWFSSSDFLRFFQVETFIEIMQHWTGFQTAQPPLHERIKNCQTDGREGFTFSLNFLSNLVQDETWNYAAFNFFSTVTAVENCDTEGFRIS